MEVGDFPSFLSILLLAASGFHQGKYKPANLFLFIHTSSEASDQTENLSIELIPEE